MAKRKSKKPSEVVPEDTLDFAAPQPTGYIEDFISGRQVKASPEEIEAVQVMARRLVKELGYPKAHITTRPQYRVRATPSGDSKSGYPVDIAVFKTELRKDDDAWIVVECKRKTRKDGERQLKLYLSMSAAQIGVWFNGLEHLYLYKKYNRDGSIDWVTLPTLPKYGQSIPDIGTLRRSELTLPTNLKSIFRDLRNHLAANAVGVTRDQVLAQAIMSLLFCKIYDELDTAPEDIPNFRASVDESGKSISDRINRIFTRVKDEYSDVFEKHETVGLDADSLRYVVGELQNYEITRASRDAIGDAFEVFIGPAVRGEEGQFFTPRNVVQMMVKLMDPEPGELLIDPACGSGGFLIVALEHMWSKLEAQAASKRWSVVQLERQKREVAMRCMRGMDKDSFLTKLTKAYMAIIGDGRGGIFCEDSLGEPTSWKTPAQESIKLQTFDVILTNPPFGSKIKVKGTHKLAQYKLARKWRAPKTEEEEWVELPDQVKEQTPQILFIERCIQLLRDGGRMGIVLPESIFGMPNYAYVVNYLYNNFRLRAFISLPEDVFQPYTHAKTCVVILEKRAPRQKDVIEMAIADWCGHDSRGNPTYRIGNDGEPELLDDIPKIADQMHSHLNWR